MIELFVRTDKASGDQHSEGIRLATSAEVAAWADAQGMALIELGDELGRFSSHPQWVSHAARVYSQARNSVRSEDYITLDSAIPRRVITRGLQFSNAQSDGTFPAVIYAISSKPKGKESDSNEAG